MYEDTKSVNVKSVRGKVHEYLSMALDYIAKGEVKIDMRKYVKKMIDEFTVHIKKYQAVASPGTKNLLKLDITKPLNNNKA